MSNDSGKSRELLPARLAGEVALHIEKVRQQMCNDGIKACLITANPNVYYLSLRFFRGYIWVPLAGDVTYFPVRPNNLAGERTVYVSKPEQIAEKLAELGESIPGEIGLEYGELSYSEISRLMAAFPGTATRDCTGTVRKARMVKTPWEIEQMKTDGTLQCDVYAKVPDFFREGMTDTELQILLEGEMRRKGCLGFPRVSGRLMQINLGSVLAGDNADEPTPYDFSMGGAGIDPSLPVGANGKVIKSGQAVMIDMNGAFNGYQSDMTRMWRVGDVEPLAMKAYDCSCEILRELERTGLPGRPVADLYNTAVEIVERYSLSEYFMGHRQKVAFIGHGVGIELNEIPVVMKRSRDILAEGMTIALEPKFVIPGVGAVGTENTYVVTSGGLVSLTPFPESFPSLVRK